MTLSMVPTLQAKDLQLLRSHLQGEASRCIHQPDGALKWRYTTPTAAVRPGHDDDADVPERSSVGHYLQMYDWDACFFSQVAERIGYSGLALDVVRNFISLKEPGGYTPRTVSPKRVWDKGDQCKPFLCQTLRLTGNVRLESDLIAGLDSYLSYFYNNRRDERGLYRWRNVLESGVDNNLAMLAPIEAAKDENLDHTVFPDGQLLACDLSAYLFAEYSSFAQIAQVSGNDQLHQEYSRRAEEVHGAVNEHLWNPALSLYCNLHPRTGEFIALRCWTGLVPLLTGVASTERAEEMIQRNIANPDHFLRPVGIPSVAASERLYNQAPRGLYGRVLVSNWQGPVWVLVNGLIVRALLQHGYRDLSRDIAVRMVHTLVSDLKNNGTLHENYHAETGQGLFAPNFVSWNLLALELLDLIEQG